LARAAAHRYRRLMDEELDKILVTMSEIAAYGTAVTIRKK
jgi:uncharacterized protein YbjQ (UPF0145 family)